MVNQPTRPRRARTPSLLAREKEQLEKDKSYVRCSVAKQINDKLHLGVVTSFKPRGRTWLVRYDDGTTERMAWGDLELAMQLHSSSPLQVDEDVVPEKESPVPEKEVAASLSLRASENLKHIIHAKKVLGKNMADSL